MWRKVSLHQINNLMLGIIILTNLYIIIAPLTPALIYWYQKNYDSQRISQLNQKIVVPKVNKVISKASIPKPSQPNQVIIPSIFLDQPIYEGHETYVELAKGVWRWPSGSTPSSGGNTILIGHRFTYTNPKGVFYELNQIKIGDLIGVIWNNKTYDYKVSSINQVLPTQTSILNQTTQPEITLYTCTPLYAPKYRLVIVAKLEAKS